MAKKKDFDLQKLKRQLLGFGKKKGHITFEELNALLPPDLISDRALKRVESELL